jgi:hypothetical protein
VSSLPWERIQQGLRIEQVLFIQRFEKLRGDEGVLLVINNEGIVMAGLRRWCFDVCSLRCPRCARSYVFTSFSFLIGIGNF